MKGRIVTIIFISLLLIVSSSSYIEKSIRELSFKTETTCSSEEDLTKYVNPFIGTGIYSKWGAMGRGNCYPGAVVPFGMVQLSPDTGNDNFAGYHYEDKYILGFSHTHLSGCGCPGLGNVLVMPIVGGLRITEDGYKSKFIHDEEIASPGYYMVMLKSYDIKAELTVTCRVGFHRYTFPSSDNAHIIIDVTHTLEDDEPVDAFVEIVDNQTIVGYVTIPNPFCGGKTPYTTYFAAKFSKPFSSYGTWNGEKIYHGCSSQSGNDIGAYINYSTSEEEVIEAKVGISYVSMEQALLNLEEEIPGWDFDEVREEARNVWNEMLHKIEVEGGSEKEKIKFYTALYHCLLMPHVFSDVNGLYIGMDDNIYRAENYTHYATFSLWDTFRSEHPLLTLILPEIQNDMIKSLIDQYEHGGWFPKWPMLNRYTNCMIGDHATAVIVDSYLKGIRNFNASKAYEGMRKSAMELPPENHDYEGRVGLPYYLRYGYVPYDNLSQSVSRTLEYAYDDWCLAQMAKALGRKEDYNLFMERANHYRNLFDPVTKFMRPRYSDGTWKKFFIPGSWKGFTEGNAWTYTWFVPHDVYGLINLMGKDTFIKRLDHFFKRFAYPAWYMPFSHYWHGNEPDEHVPYFYNYAGEPWKTQYIVRKIMDELYDITASGIPGNDDCGQLSSWYVFSAMGFYPVCPGNTSYQIGSPIFSKIVIHLDSQYYDGDEFIIIARNVSEENKYIQSMTLNGIPLNRTWIDHSEIVNGGTLIFEMGDNPKYSWMDI